MYVCTISVKLTIMNNYVQNNHFYKYLHKLAQQNIQCFSFTCIGGHLFCVDIFIHFKMVIK